MSVTLHSVSLGQMARFDHNRWSVCAWPDGGVILYVRGDGGGNVQLQDLDSVGRLLTRWVHVRVVYGGPTAAEVRDAIMACRDALASEEA